MSDNKKMKKKRGKGRGKRYAITAALAIICIFGVGYGYTVCAYHSRFLSGTTINGIDVGGLTVAEAKEKVQKKEGHYVVTLKFRDNKSESIKGKDFNFHYLDEYNIQELLDMQNSQQLYHLFGNRNKSYQLKADYSERKLKKCLAKMPEMKKKNMVEPEDAHPVFKKGTFIIEPETMGTTLDEKKVCNTLEQAVEIGKHVVELDSIYKNPKIFSDNKTLNKQISKLNKLAGTSVTYLLPNGKKQVLNGTTLVKWLVKDKKGIYKKDQIVWGEKLQAYVHELAESVETVWSAHKFHTTAGTDIMLPGSGYYGWQIDETKEVEQLSKDLESKKAEKREPIYSKREATDYADNYGFGNTYCEINLSSQHLWIYKDGAMVLQTAVVSGKNDPKHKTPAGAFTAYDKRQNKIMRGERRPNGTYEYETNAKYWIRLNNQGVGLHDAPWRSSFGGNIWRTGGSHGCVNLPASVAPKIYELIDNGTPIAVYY